MKNILELCAESRVHISLVGDNLKIDFDEQPSAELVSLLKENKQKIIAFLKTEQEQKSGPILKPLNFIADEESNVALSYGQKRLWVTQKMGNGSAQYNMLSAFKLSGELQQGGLQSAVDALVQRHSSLRTVFVQDEHKEVHQKVLSNVTVPMECQDLREFKDFDIDDRVQAIIAEQAEREFDFESGCLMRCGLLQISHDEYVFVLNVHHIASDGWSLQIIANEICELYNSNVEQRTAKLRELPLQYIDYADWQNKYVQSDTAQQSLAFWKQILEDVPAVHGLPTAKVRRPAPDISGSRSTCSINREQVEKLKAFAANEKVTFFMLVHAIYVLVLSRFSNSEDIVLGAPVANRLNADIESLVGFFANTLVLRSKIDKSLSFIEHLKEVKACHMAAQQHQDIPFDYLIEKLNPVRDGSYTPLVQLALTMDDNRRSEASFTGLTAKPYSISQPFARFELSLNLHTTDEGIDFEFEYMNSLFSNRLILGLQQSLLQVIDAIISNPDTAVINLPLVPVEQQMMMMERNRNALAEYDRRVSISGLISQQVTKTPQRTALIFEDNEISYAELEDQANSIANHLMSNGVKAGDLVALCCERSTQMVTSLIAILKVGAAYLPLDPCYPDKRIDYILQDANVGYLLCSDIVAQSIDFPPQVTQLSISDSLSASNSESLMVNNATGDQLAYMIYTSGSTGLPKGVRVRNRNVINLFTGMGKKFGEWNEPAKWLASTSICFDISVLELFWTLSRGDTVVIQPEMPKQNGAREAFFEYLGGQLWNPQELIIKHNITHLQCTPSYLQHWPSAEGGRKALNDLVLLLVCGETLTESTAEALYRSVNGRVFNMYGPTETTVYASGSLVTGPDVSIGIPISNTQLYVLDKDMCVVPEGIPGELYIGGEGVAQGYHNREALSEEKFIGHLFSDQGMMYRTGDMVKWREDGQLSFIGRLDEQVKVNGYRIELAEISYQLDCLDSVESSLVLPFRSESTADSLVAFVQLNNEYKDQDDKVVKQQLQRALGALLPSFMTPSQYVFVEEWEKNANGKIDKKAMLDSLELNQQQTEVFKTPTTSTEEKLVAIWAEMLAKPIEKISTNANFFHLGGHSLLVVTMIDLVNERFDTCLKVSDVFSALTIESLAHSIELESMLTSNSLLVNELEESSIEEIEF